MKKLPRILLFAGLVSLAFAAQGDIRPRGFSSIDRTMPLTTAVGQRILTFREIRTDVTLPSGKRNNGILLVLFDQASGFYLSRFGTQPETRPVESWDSMIANSV